MLLHISGEPATSPPANFQFSSLNSKPSGLIPQRHEHLPSETHSYGLERGGTGRAAGIISVAQYYFWRRIVVLSGAQKQKARHEAGRFVGVTVLGAYRPVPRYALVTRSTDTRCLSTNPSDPKGHLALMPEPLFVATRRLSQAVANSIFSISVGSSSSARELLTRFDTGHFCNRSLAAGFNNSMPASVRSHGS